MNVLRPKSDSLETYGKVSYHEKTHAWCRIRLPKIILDKFPQLKKRSNIITYKLEVYSSYDSLIRKIIELKKEDEGIPLLLYLHQE